MSDKSWDIRRIADERSRRNATHPDHMGILGDPDRIDADGVAGELAFAQAFSFATSFVHAEHPTACNFVLRDGTRVDVRSSRAAGYLLVPVKKLPKIKAEAFVLARVSAKTGRATLVGWATRADVEAAPTMVPTQRDGGMLCHTIDARSLRPITELLARHDVPSGRLPGFD